jgi:hypothetical protein
MRTKHKGDLPSIGETSLIYSNGFPGENLLKDKQSAQLSTAFYADLPPF